MINKNKRGVSVMVAYVLLIVIAIGISAGVYSFLKVYVPKDQAQCPEDVRLITQNFSCDSGQTNPLTISFANKGLFSVDAVYVRIARSERKIRQLINDPKDLKPTEVDKFFIDLPPGQSLTESYKATPVEGPGNYTLEIQPAVYDGDILAICENAVVTQNIVCN